MFLKVMGGKFNLPGPFAIGPPPFASTVINRIAPQGSHRYSRRGTTPLCYRGHPAQSWGCSPPTLTFNQQTVPFRVFVLNNCDNLLSRDAALRLGLVKRLDNINDLPSFPPLYEV